MYSVLLTVSMSTPCCKRAVVISNILSTISSSDFTALLIEREREGGRREGEGGREKGGGVGEREGGRVGGRGRGGRGGRGWRGEGERGTITKAHTTHCITHGYSLVCPGCLASTDVSLILPPQPLTITIM